MAGDGGVHHAEEYPAKKGPSTMAETPQSEETGNASDATAPGAGRPQGLFGSSATILLLIFAVAVFWWSRRRRVEMEERLRTQRREAEATAQQSALDVAHLMRAAPQPGAAAAAAEEGLASAARMPSAASAEPAAGAKIDARPPIEDGTPDLTQTPFGGAEHDAQARAIERAEAVTAADRAAEEQAVRAARDAGMTGESAMRRMAAAQAAAEEAIVDTAEAEQAGLRAAVPTGAIAGDGSASCPPDYPIKGNAQSRIFHRPGQVSYPSTIAEYCFDSVDAAEAAGFRQSRAREQRSPQ
jgi:hypothetical protein